MIDPIDGTWGFIKKDGDFGVQIGLTENGAAILGVVYLPVHGKLYFAVKNEGAFLVENAGNPQRLRVSDKIDFAQMNLASSRNHRSPRMHRIIENFRHPAGNSARLGRFESRFDCRTNLRFIRSSFAAHEVLGHLRAANNFRSSGRRNDRRFRHSVAL
jgi:fructose-1,6-bisphosphatase/inositol monophosphatase family enzyme